MKKITIPPSFFERNRHRLSVSMKKDSLAVFHSNDEMNRTGDQNYPYRQDSDLFYLTGINQEKTTLLMAPNHPDETMREILVIRRSNPRLETWEGHKLTAEEASALSGISNVRYQDEMDNVLAPLMMYCGTVYLNLPEYFKFIPELPVRNLRLADELMKRFPAHSYERLAPIMRDLRTVKSPEEVALIKEACRITNDSFRNVLQTVKPGIWEYEVEALMTYDFIRNGARGHAYPPIIGTGKNACILHYIDNNCQCLDGELLLMDFGAEVGNYAADCTRTIPVSGRFSARQKEVYQSVLDVLRFACTLIKPGSSLQKVHQEVCRRFGQEHVKLGLYTADELSAQDPKNPLFMKYYMHGTSHFLGLDVHDVGNREVEFRPGMVMTCEPAIYLPEEQMAVRLENNVLVTDHGNIDLMADFPIEIADIERIMQEREP